MTIKWFTIAMVVALAVTIMARGAHANDLLRMELIVYTETGVEVYDVSEEECYAIVGELGELYDTVAMCVAPKRTVI
jgi:hypothetical protein